LARALAVRGFLIERGIKASRIDLRALGHTAAVAEADRVDVVVADK
jgi:outer membrane protein OmpA-like peptidoglycan-associated protein